MIHLYWGHGRPLLPWLPLYLRQLHNGDKTPRHHRRSRRGGIEVFEWDETKLPFKLRALCDRAMPLVPRQYGWRHRANIVRAWMLREHGGVWLDYDAIPLAPIVDLWPRPWAMEAGRGKLCSCGLGFDAGDPILDALIEHIERSIGQGLPPRTSPLASGEQLLQSVGGGAINLHSLRFDSRGNVVDPTSPLIHLWGHRVPPPGEA